MQFILDHTLAVVCGGALILGVLTLQANSRHHAVSETISGAARSQAGSVLETLTQEFDNLLSENQALSVLGTYRCRLEQDALGERTTRVEAPVFVSAGGSGAPQAGHVMYTLVATGDSVQVGPAWLKTHRLERSVDTGSGYGAAAVVAEGLVDFDVTFHGRASERTSGVPPLRFSNVGVEVALALPSPSANRLNVARVGRSVRPPNLVTGS